VNNLIKGNMILGIGVLCVSLVENHLNIYCFIVLLLENCGLVTFYLFGVDQ
jgi:hypothetical protein